jgi:hypothetical protein
MGLVAVSAAALSFVSLWRLGQLAGYGALSPLYPVVLDLGAAASCACWLHAKSRQASVMTWALLGLSVLLNGTVHWLTATKHPPSWPLVVGVAAIPPLVLGLIVHLSISMEPKGGHTGHDEKGFHTVDPVGSIPTVPDAAPTTGAVDVDRVGLGYPCDVVLPRGVDVTSVVERRAQPSEHRTLPEVDPVAELIASGAGRRRIAAELGVTEYEARKLLASRNGVAS